MKKMKKIIKTIGIIMIILIVLISSSTIGLRYFDNSKIVGEKTIQNNKEGGDNSENVSSTTIAIENREKRLVLYFNGKIAVIGKFQLKSFHEIIDLKNQLISEGYSIDKVKIEYISHENDPYVFMIEIIECLRKFGFSVITETKF